MKTKQGLMHPTREANFPSWVQNAKHDPPIIDFLHMEPIMVAIGMTITFCTLWFLIVFILYQLTRTALSAAL